MKTFYLPKLTICDFIVFLSHTLPLFCPVSGTIAIMIMISSDLWLQHPDLNPVNYKICTDSAAGLPQKIHNMNEPTYGMALSNGSSIMLQKSGVNVCECVFM